MPGRILGKILFLQKMQTVAAIQKQLGMAQVIAGVMPTDKEHSAHDPLRERGFSVRQ
jgi:cation transport ATPase